MLRLGDHDEIFNNSLRNRISISDINNLTYIQKDIIDEKEVIGISSEGYYYERVGKDYITNYNKDKNVDNEISIVSMNRKQDDDDLLLFLF